MRRCPDASSKSCTSVSVPSAQASFARSRPGRGSPSSRAVDIDPAKAGQDLGEVCGVGRKLRVKVTDDIAKTIKATRPDVAVLCTSSSLKKVLPEFEAVLKLKVPIVSTTEELAYPVKSNAASGEEDRRAGEARACGRARHGRQSRVRDGRAADRAHRRLRARRQAIEVDRVQDARIRRLPFQKKIGAGLTPDEFMDKVKDGSVRHVGLAESITMIADALGWKLDKVTDEIQPKIADKRGVERVPERRSGPGRAGSCRTASAIARARP